MHQPPSSAISPQPASVANPPPFAPPLWHPAPQQAFHSTQDQFLTVGNPYPLGYQANQQAERAQTQHFFPDDISSGNVTSVSFFDSTRATGSQGNRYKAKRKDRAKPYKVPTSSEFGDHSDVYDRAKLTYAADRLLRDTLPMWDNKAQYAQSALTWAAKELNRGKLRHYL